MAAPLLIFGKEFGAAVYELLFRGRNIASPPIARKGKSAGNGRLTAMRKTPPCLC